MPKLFNGRILVGTFALGCLLSMQSSAAEHVISQKGKKFNHEKIFVKVGDTVSFVNDDNVYHNIYSDSSSNYFELGMYRKGEERKAVFKKPGSVEVRCLIHPQMKLDVEVSQ